MISLHRIAGIVSGTLHGNGEYGINSIHSLECATEDSLAFFRDRKKKPLLEKTRAGAVLLAPAHQHWFSGNKIVVSDPCLAHAQISGLFKKYPPSQRPGVDHSSMVSAGAWIGGSVCIGPYSTVADGAKLGSRVILRNGVHVGEDVKIGDDTVIEDRVVIYPGCTIGARCCISAGVVIGASGFGYAPHQGKWQKIEQLGSVVIGDDVDIGANTTIDRGTLGNTRIGNGVKLDNQIQIAHNVMVGDDTIIAGCVGVAGSAVIGRRCRLGGRVGVLGHLEIADDVTVLSNSLVTRTIKSPGEYASAIGVQPAGRWRKNAAIVRRLDKLVDKVRELGKQKQ